MSTRVLTQRWHPVWAGLSYGALTLILTYPLVGRLSSALPSDLGDPLLNTWILWWNSTVLPFSEAWWHAPLFYPTADGTAFTEHLVGISLFATPIIWVTGSPVVAYNTAFLLSFPLSGLAAYLLCYQLTGRRDAAWVAGLAYGFCPYRIDQIPHLQVLSSYWMPLALLGLHRYLAEPRWRWLALFGVSSLLQGLSNGYYLLYFPILVMGWLVWFLPAVHRWKTLAAVGGAWAVGVLPLAPILWRYQQVHERFGFVRSLGEVRSFSADVTGLISAPELLNLWGFLDAFRRPEGQLFPGLAVVILILVGLTRVERVVREHPTAVVTWGRRGLAASAAVLFMAAIVGWAIGPWEVTVLGLDIIVDSLDKPISEGLVFLVLFALTSPTVRTARRLGSAFGFYLLAAAGLWILTLGPFPMFMGQQVILDAPYLWLMQLPGFDALRVPARFWMVAVGCVSIAAGLAFARAVPVSARWGRVALGIVSVAILGDGWTTRMPVVQVPARSQVLEQAAAGPVLELPLGAFAGDVAAMYRAIHHGRPVANGYSGHTAPHYQALAHGLETLDHDILTALSRLGVRDVLVTRNTDVDGAYANFLAAHAGTRLVASHDRDSLYRLPVAAPAPPRAQGAIVPVMSLEANVDADHTSFAVDGDRATRWTSGLQRPGHELVIALDTTHVIEAVILELGPFVNDFPRLLLVELSDDRQTWVEAWRGPTSAEAMVGALADPIGHPIEVRLDGRSARYVRLRQLATDPVHYWSIAELHVVASVP